jgi:hypothetical protein
MRILVKENVPASVVQALRGHDGLAVKESMRGEEPRLLSFTMSVADKPQKDPLRRHRETHRGDAGESGSLQFCGRFSWRTSSDFGVAVTGAVIHGIIRKGANSAFLQSP